MPTLLGGNLLTKLVKTELTLYWGLNTFGIKLELLQAAQECWHIILKLFSNETTKSSGLKGSSSSSERFLTNIENIGKAKRRLVNMG